jgi:hypothetical protein
MGSILVFEDNSAENPVCFLENLPTHKFTWLNTIIINPDPDAKPSPGSELENGTCAFESLNFCTEVANHRNLTVHYILPSLTSRHPSDTIHFIWKCFIIRGAMHGLKWPYVHPASCCETYIYTPQMSRAERITLENPNFRMVPNDAVDDSWIRRTVENICEEGFSGRVLSLWIYYASKWDR